MSGKAFVIRPKKSYGVGRVEQDKEKLNRLYRQGYQDAADSYGKLMEFLER